MGNAGFLRQFHLRPPDEESLDDQLALLGVEFFQGGVEMLAQLRQFDLNILESDRRFSGRGVLVLLPRLPASGSYRPRPFTCAGDASPPADVAELASPALCAKPEKKSPARRHRHPVSCATSGRQVEKSAAGTRSTSFANASDVAAVADSVQQVDLAHLSHDGLTRAKFPPSETSCYQTHARVLLLFTNQTL
jgi:hypothetical protein